MCFVLQVKPRSFRIAEFDLGAGGFSDFGGIGVDGFSHASNGPVPHPGHLAADSPVHVPYDDMDSARHPDGGVDASSSRLPLPPRGSAHTPSPRPGPPASSATTRWPPHRCPSDASSSRARASTTRARRSRCRREPAGSPRMSGAIRCGEGRCGSGRDRANAAGCPRVCRSGRSSGVSRRSAAGAARMSWPGRGCERREERGGGGGTGGGEAQGETSTMTRRSSRR